MLRFIIEGAAIAWFAQKSGATVVHTKAMDALADTMMHLRMVSAGHTSYSASPTRFDKAAAEIVAERLHLFGFRLAPIEAEGGDVKQAPSR